MLSDVYHDHSYDGTVVNKSSKLIKKVITNDSFCQTESRNYLSAELAMKEKMKLVVKEELSKSILASVRSMRRISSVRNKGNKLCAKTRMLVRRVNVFCSKLIALFPTMKSTASMLTSSILDFDHRTVTKAMKMPVSQNLNRLPACARAKVKLSDEQNRQRLLSLYPEMVYDQIRCLIHLFYKSKTHFSISSLNKKLTADFASDFDWSVNDKLLRSILNAMDIRCAKIRDRIYIWEKTELIQLRHTYIRSLRNWREQGAFFSYLDETWFFRGMGVGYAWCDFHAYANPTDYTKKGWKVGPDPPACRGERAIVLGVITERGILDGSFKTLISGGDVSDADYHKVMNAACFESYLEETCPSLVAAANGRQPILIMDNAAYHKRQLVKIPTKASKKSEIVDFLEKNNVSDVNMSLRKASLLAILEKYLFESGGREALKKYATEEIAARYGVKILWLPPYHCILNPIEYYWGWLKSALAKIVVPSDRLITIRDKAAELIRQMPDEMRPKFFKKTLEVEEDFVRKEGIFNNVAKPFVLCLDADSGEVDLHSSESSEEDDEETAEMKEERVKLAEIRAVTTGKYRRVMKRKSN